MRRVVLWKPDMRFIAGVAVAALVLLMIPLLRIIPYCVPWYDDYSYGKFVKNFLEQKYSLGSALEGAVYCVKTQWYAWQGTYSSIFFMSLMPAVWGEQYYFLGPLFLVLILPVSVCVLVKTLIRDVLKADLASCVTIQCAAAAMVVVLIYTSQQGLFWYNAGIHYVGMHSFLMLLIAAWVKLLSGAGKAASLVLVLWTLAGAVLAGGANFVTTLQGILVGLSLLALGLLLNNKRTWLLVPSILVYGVGLYKNLSAPGNNVRKAIYEDSGYGMDAVSAIANSFVEAFRNLWEFTGLITLAVMLLLAPVIWYMVKRTRFRFRYPGLLLLWSFCLYATGFTPSLYSMGHAGVSRTLNAVKISYQILLLLNQVYWLGWFYRKLERAEKTGLSGWRYKWVQTALLVSEKSVPICFYFVMGILMLGIFAVEPNQAGSYSSFGAYYYVHSGEANNFHQEYLNRVEIIKESSDVAVVEAYHYRPWMLCVGDLSEDSDNEANRVMARWYDKLAVICSQ